MTITQSLIPHVIGVMNEGKCVLKTKDGSEEFEKIKSTMFDNSKDYCKVKNFYVTYRLLFMVLISSFFQGKVL